MYAFYLFGDISAGMQARRYFQQAGHMFDMWNNHCEPCPNWWFHAPPHKTVDFTRVQFNSTE